MQKQVTSLVGILCLLAQPAQPAPVTVQVRGDRLDVQADKVPLVQVLNTVAWETKMKIVYDTTPPQTPITVDLKDTTVRDAITEILEGHGLIYAARMDSSGTRVDTLVLTSAAAGEVRMDIPDPPPPDPYVAEVPPEYQPEYVPPPDYIPYTGPTPQAPSAAWTPAPVVLPSGFGPDGAVPPPQMQGGGPQGQPPPGGWYGASGPPPYPQQTGSGGPMGSAHSSHRPPLYPEWTPPPPDQPPPQ